VIILQIHVVGVTILKSKRHAPIRSDRDGPDTRTVTLERVQPECRLVHILCVIGLVKCREDQPQAVNVIGFDLSPVVFFKEASQTLVFEALNHWFQRKT
jgi:hypothetical protein